VRFSQVFTRAILRKSFQLPKLRQMSLSQLQQNCPMDFMGNNPECRFGVFFLRGVLFVLTEALELSTQMAPFPFTRAGHSRIVSEGDS
jgi:hypothetical protein